MKENTKETHPITTTISTVIEAEKQDDFYGCQSSSCLAHNDLSFFKTGHLLIVDYLLNRHPFYAFPDTQKLDDLLFYFIHLFFTIKEECLFILFADFFLLFFYI